MRNFLENLLEDGVIICNYFWGVFRAFIKWHAARIDAQLLVSLLFFAIFVLATVVL